MKNNIKYFISNVKRLITWYNFFSSQNDLYFSTEEEVLLTSN
jgi:hypothetical protein